VGKIWRRTLAQSSTVLLYLQLQEEHKMGIAHEILVVIQQMYAKNEAEVKIGKRTSIGYKTTEGLKQRCGLSQSLFKIYLESELYD
jgi:hypothetical protein